MKKVNSKLLVLSLTCILFIISFAVIVINGKTYTLKLNIDDSISNIDEVNVEIESKEIVKLIDKKIENGNLILKFKSVNVGKTSIDITYKEYYDAPRLYRLYVHSFGIITYDNFFGDSNCSIIVQISLAILLGVILYLLIKKYRYNIKENMYQYKNVTYLGMVVFLSFAFINSIIMIFNYQGLISTIEGTFRLFNGFSLLALPIALIVFILVTISNIKLVRKEGLNYRNLLGLILGLFLCFMTIFSDLLNDVILQRATWIDVHNLGEPGPYIQNFFECLIYLIATYLECLLIGTIVLGIKAAKHVPNFDKDCILILGCKIKKDGTLTNLLKSRVDKAIEFRDMQKKATGKDIIFIPSGGKGNDEVISEAEAISNYLIEQGIDKKNILIENKSTNTYQNIKFSNELISKKIKNPSIAFSTTNYHVFRSGVIATNQGLKIEGIGAPTKSYFWINAFIREYIATLFSERKRHITIILIILIISIFMIGISYLSNVL